MGADNTFGETNFNPDTKVICQSWYYLNGVKTCNFDKCPYTHSNVYCGMCLDEDKLYQCPYERACKYNLKDCCLECETFGEYLNGNTILASQSTLSREKVIKIIENEPELSGAMPSQMFDIIKEAVLNDDKTSIEEYLRTIVRVTKRNIVNKITNELLSLSLPEITDEEIEAKYPTNFNNIEIKLELKGSMTQDVMNIIKLISKRNKEYQQGAKWYRSEHRKRTTKKD